MQDIVAAIPAVSAVIEKGGIIGVLLIVCTLLVWEVLRLRKELARTYLQRDKWRLAFVTVKGAADHAGAKYDLSMLADLIGGEDAT